MAIKEIRRAQLVKGGDIIKQGETFTLGFLFFDANDRIIQLGSSDGITVKLANNTGVILETTATKVEDRVEFSVNENIGYGEMRVEFTVTSGEEVQKYPASDWIRLKITPSLDDTGIGNVYAVTATEMFSRIGVAETKATTAETKAISAETTATNVQRDFDQILKEAGDSNPEIVAARLGEENLRILNEKTMARLADTTNINEKLQVSISSFPKLTGETTDRQRIQRMVDYAVGKGFGKVYITKELNPYIVDGTPVLLPSNIIIASNGAKMMMLAGTYNKGIGFFTTRTDANGVPNVDVTYEPSINPKENISFEGKLILDGNMANVSCTYANSTGNGVTLYRVKKARIEGLEIINLPGTTGGGYGIIAAYCETVYIDKVIVNRTDRQNICIWETLDAHIDTSTLNYSHMRECILVSTNSPVQFQKSHCIVRNTSTKNLSESAVHVIRFSGEGSGSLDNVDITGSSLIDGLFVTDTYYKAVSIKNTKIRNCLYGIRVASNTNKYIYVGEGTEVENCVNGIQHSATGGIAIYSKLKIKGSSGVPFFLGYADIQTVEGLDVDGGTRVNFNIGTAGQIIGCKFRGLTDPNYAVIVEGAGVVQFGLNNMFGNANNRARIYNSGKAFANIGTIESTSVTIT